MSAKHNHRPSLPPEYRGFSGAVKQPENRGAHGNVCKLDTCRCGATRATNINGNHIERGPWTAAKGVKS